MAVFTRITQSEMQEIIAGYALGSLVDYQEVSEGIENSNYFVTTSPDFGVESRWVLTVFEQHSEQELPFFMELTTALAAQGLQVPAPVRDRHGRTVNLFGSKPFALFPRFPGKWLQQPDASHRETVAGFLANMHNLALPVFLTRKQTRDARWMVYQASKVKELINNEDRHLLERVFGILDENHRQLSVCPKTIIHGDLFRDNVLFDDGQISGVIDFYHACEDIRIFDLAVAINDWCAEEVGGLDWSQVQQMMAAYEKSVVLTEAEHQIWPVVMLLAAARFWISRLVSRTLQGYQSSATTGDITKDPNEFREKLKSILDHYSL